MSKLLDWGILVGLLVAGGTYGGVVGGLTGLIAWFVLTSQFKVLMAARNQPSLALASAVGIAVGCTLLFLGGWAWGWASGLVALVLSPLVARGVYLALR